MRNGKRVVDLIEQISPIQAVILRELIVDGRKSIAEIAKKNRLKKKDALTNYAALEKEGIIKGATIHINYLNFGFKAVGHLIVSAEPTQADSLVSYALNLPEVYFAYTRGPKGSIDITITLKTLRDLEKIKDQIRKHFSIAEIKTAIWTSVKEMNQNLSIFEHNATSAQKQIDTQIRSKKTSPAKEYTVDQTDLKIADQLSKNGRAPMEEIAKEVGISVDTAKKRYQRLKDQGTLKVTIQFDPTRIGYKALGTFFAVTSNVNPATVIEQIGKIPDIISIMKTSGTYDLQIFAMLRDLDQLLNVQEELGKVQGITTIEPEILRIPTTWPTPRQYISTF